MEIRLPLVLFGSAVAVLSAVQNSILFYLFFSRSALRNSHFLHLAFLSFCDILVALSYLAIMLIQVLMEEYRSAALSTIWHGYLRVTFTLSHVALVASTYLIISATLERAISSLHVRFSVTPPRRLGMIIAAFLIAILLRGTMFFEYIISYQPRCTNQNIYAVLPTALAVNKIYSEAMFISRHFFTVFFPFFLLAYLNVSIVRSLRSGRGPNPDREHQSRKDVQAATRLLIFVVTCYLCTQTLSVVMSFWEHIDREGMYAKHEKFVALSVDIVSLLAVLSASIRLEVYAWTSPQIRRELKALRNNAFQHCCRKRQRGSGSTYRLATHYTNGSVDAPTIRIQVRADGISGSPRTQPLHRYTSACGNPPSYDSLVPRYNKLSMMNSSDLIEVAV